MTSEKPTLTTITVTGADERTDLNHLAELTFATRRFGLEVGLLYTARPEGRPRYPSLDWLHAAAERLAGHCAIHICGREAREQLRIGSLGSLAGLARRVQVNGIVTAEELPALAERAGKLITQHTEGNANLANADVRNHEILVDGSGGRAQSPAAWARPQTPKSVGFAGGLGPLNIDAELQRIAAVARGPYWIDLEGKLRTDDWFDLAKVEAFINAVAGHPCA